MKTASVFLVLALSTTGLRAQNPAPPGDLPGWKLTWHDEFDGEKLDTNTWNVMDAELKKNKELQYYTPEDVYLENGHLVLRSQKRDMGTRHYTSGHVDTKNHFSQEYGRFEVRAKLPTTQGLWPAHWMLPEAGGWPPEIDIMEMIGKSPRRILMTVHWRENGHPEHSGFSYVGPDYSADYHLFAVEWDPDRLTWFIDGVRRHMTKLHSPSTPFYVILNTAVGGILPGNPDDTTVFPQYHSIDYVRVYQRPERLQTNAAPTDPPPPTPAGRSSVRP